jgi:serine protease AprX
MLIAASVRPLATRPVLPLPVRLNADVRATGAGVCIAMVDSDFVIHPDLMEPTARIVRYYDAVEDRTADLPPTEPSARHWHGTMTACTAAGNGHLARGRFTSLAPAATVVLIRTMNDAGRVTTPTIVRALHHIRDHADEFGIRVVNLSVYSDEIDQTLDHPVNAAVEEIVSMGIVVVAAAGNNPYAPIRPPAAAPSALTVGGLDDKNTLDGSDESLYHSTFGITQLGVQKPELIAPAIWLPAPILPGTTTHTQASALCALDMMTDDMLLACAPSLLPHSGLPLPLWTSRDVDELRDAIDARIESELIASPYYKMVDGTSFAAPIIASVVAQMLEVAPSLTPADVKTILMSTARPLDTYPSIRQGAGVVHQRAALAKARMA